jgi:hypothetical protein
MRTFKILTVVAIAFLGLTSCSNDDDAPQLLEVESELVSNLFAPTTSVNGPMGPTPDGGDFTKFNFSTGTTTTSETDWDIAFRATTIAVNGGVETGTDDEPVRNGNAAVYISENTFAEVTQVNTTLFNQDSANGFAITPSSDLGWYNYSGFGNPNPADDNLIRPIAGRVLVFRTRDGRYAKVEILSYYENNPETPNGFTDTPRYYTFNYVYQPNEDVTTFE